MTIPPILHEVLTALNGEHAAYGAPRLAGSERLGTNPNSESNRVKARRIASFERHQILTPKGTFLISEEDLQSLTAAGVLEAIASSETSTMDRVLVPAGPGRCRVATVLEYAALVDEIIASRGR